MQITFVFVTITKKTSTKKTFMNGGSLCSWEHSQMKECECFSKFRDFRLFFFIYKFAHAEFKQYMVILLL